MKVELMMPAGPIPVLPHGARPLPMVMLHVANCGRNCGIRKGRPIPVALPRIEEDYAGEWEEERPRTVRFTETLPTRDWYSKKFRIAKQMPIIVHSPSTHQLELQRIFDVYCSSPGPEYVDDDDDEDDDEDIQLIVKPDDGEPLASILIPKSETPEVDQVKLVIEVDDLEEIFKHHKRLCAAKCGHGKRRTRPGLFEVIIEDVEGEVEETESTSIVNSAASPDSATSPEAISSPDNVDSPSFADSESSTPASVASAASSISQLSQEEGDCTYITSTRGLLGLGLLHMPGSTSLSTVSSDLSELVTPPESPVRYEMDITDYHTSLVDEWRSRFAKSSTTTSA